MKPVNWLSPSAASRWLQCPASSALATLLKVPKQPTTTVAREGIKAHTIAERWIKEGKQPLIASKDHVYYLKGYVNYVQQMQVQASYAFTELKVDLGGVVIEGVTGTVDSALIGLKAPEGHYNVISDLKYGKGVSVSAVDNSQLMLYALGVVELTKLILDYEPEFTLVNIFQPRRVDYSKPKVAIVYEHELAAFTRQVEIAVGRYNSYLTMAAEAVWAKVTPSKEACMFCPPKNSCWAYGESGVLTGNFLANATEFAD